MAREIRLPQLGEGIDAAKVVRVLVKEGDEVEKDQPLIEVESDKASMEVPAPEAGRIAELTVGEGDEVAVDDVIARLEAKDGAQEGEEREERREPGEKRGRKRRGEDEEEVAEAAEAEPDEQPTGAGEEEREAEDDEAEDDEGKDEGGKDEERGKEPPRRGGTRPRERTPASGLHAAERSSRVEPDEGEPARREARPPLAAPSVRRFAREVGVDIGAVRPRGERVTIADVKEHARLRGGAGGPAAGADGELEQLERWGGVERQPLSGVRKVIAERMGRSWRSAPHVTLHAEADATQVEGFRQRHKARADARGVKLTLTAILVHVCARALRLQPRLNASLDEAAGELLLRRAVHVGVAVDTERGLLVPVVRDADRLGLLDVAAELGALSERARQGKLRPDAMQGAGFTLTNLGSLGVGAFTPILNPPEVAVLGVGRARSVPEYVAGELKPRLKLPLSLSFDHRALDGADGARFLKLVVEALEDPLTLALQTPREPER